MPTITMSIEDYAAAYRQAWENQGQRSSATSRPSILKRRSQTPTIGLSLPKRPEPVKRFASEVNRAFYGDFRHSVVGMDFNEYAHYYEDGSSKLDREEDHPRKLSKLDEDAQSTMSSNLAFSESPTTLHGGDEDAHSMVDLPQRTLTVVGGNNNNDHLNIPRESSFRNPAADRKSRATMPGSRNSYRVSFADSFTPNYTSKPTKRTNTRSGDRASNRTSFMDTVARRDAGDRTSFMDAVVGRRAGDRTSMMHSVALSFGETFSPELNRRATADSFASVDDGASVDSFGEPIKKKEVEPEGKYPPKRTVIVTTIALLLTMFLITLDKTILSPALATITDEFDGFSVLAWYGGSYLLTSCAFQLVYGQMYAVFAAKWIYIPALGTFVIGSLICAVSESSDIFILGRSIAGVGSAGLYAGTATIANTLVPLQKTPMIQALLGMVFAVASVIGPLLGGLFTSDLSWRWCFYVNLPTGVICLIILFFTLKVPPKPADAPKVSPFKGFLIGLKKLDLFGVVLFLPSIVSLLLALEWAGTTYAWNSWRIILLLVLFAVLLISFCVWEWHKGDTASVPPRVVRQRTVAAVTFFQFCAGASQLVIIYYTNIWLQAIKSASAVRSGILMIPMLVAMCLGSFVSGALVTRTGYYNPAMIACSFIATLGAGLLLLLKSTSSEGDYIGITVCFGFGMGLATSQIVVAVQNALPQKDAPIGYSLTYFSSALGSSVFLSVAQSVLTTGLTSGFASIPGLGADAVSLAESGATTFINSVPEDERAAVLVAYNAALVDVFEVALAMMCFSFIGALAMEWRSIKSPKAKMGDTEGKHTRIEETQESGNRDSLASLGFD